MSLINPSLLSATPAGRADQQAELAGCDEAVAQLCQLYPEIESWQPELIAGAWHQWCAQNSLLPAVPEQRDEAFPLYLVSLIRKRMEEMNVWR